MLKFLLLAESGLLGDASDVKDVAERAINELKGIFDNSPLCGIFVVLIFLALLSFIFRGGKK